MPGVPKEDRIIHYQHFNQDKYFLKISSCVICSRSVMVYNTPYDKQLDQFSPSVLSDSLRPCGRQARQASLSITNFWSLLKLMSIESVMSSTHLILCRLLLSAFNLSQH